MKYYGNVSAWEALGLIYNLTRWKIISDFMESVKNTVLDDFDYVTIERKGKRGTVDIRTSELYIETDCGYVQLSETSIRCNNSKPWIEQVESPASESWKYFDLEHPLEKGQTRTMVLDKVWKQYTGVK